MRYRDARLNEFGDLVLRSRPDCLFTFFFAMLGGLHGTIALLAFYHGRWEAYLSAAFCGVFLLVAIACRAFRSEMAMRRDLKQIHIRTGVGRLSVERRVAFGAISAVRLTLLAGERPESSTIELICYDDDLRCPPSAVPRQEALLLAIILDVPLIKVYGDHAAPDPERANASI